MTREQLPSYFNSWIDQALSPPIGASFVSSTNGVAPGLLAFSISESGSVFATFDPADGWSIDSSCEGSLIVHRQPHPAYQCIIKPSAILLNHYDLDFL